MSPSSFAPGSHCWCLAISRSLALLLLVVALGFAKELPINAIILYDSPKGPAYVQVADLLINGKAELRSCIAGQRIDKSAYGKLAKVTLAGGSSLERTLNGLLLTKDSGPVCVVPPNLKFEKDAAYTPSELADRAILQSKTAALSGGDQSLPLFKVGVKLVFVAAPDVELAEYLLAQRAATISAWQEYLTGIFDQVWKLVPRLSRARVSRFPLG